MEKNRPPTQQEIEETLSKRIRGWYQKKLDHQPSEITVKLFHNHLYIVIDQSLSAAEKLLIEEGDKKIAQLVRWELDEIKKQQLKEIIEEVLTVKVADLLSDATLDTERAGVIAILAEPPEILSDFIKKNGGDVDKLGSLQNLQVIEQLSERESEVLQLLALGYTNEQIGERLFVTIGTVKNHVHSIIQKFGVSDRTQVAVWALRSGLVE